jgi:hypothetical protein
MNVCKWPGCNVEVKENTLCGHHQIATKVAFTFVLGICEPLRIEREIAIKWACKFAPHIVTETGVKATPFELITELDNALAVKVLICLGSKERSAYKRAAAMRRDGKVPTEDLIRMAIVEKLWVPVDKMAREIGTTHRYLRHLLYEDKVPTIVSLSVGKPGHPIIKGFLRTRTEELRKALKRVDKRRKRE